MAKKTSHCHRDGGFTQTARRVGGVGAKVVYGLMDDDSECAFCTASAGDHSRSCPVRSTR